MAITIASYTANLVNNQATCPKPTGLAVGDLMICQLLMIEKTDVATWGTGWVQIRKDTQSTSTGIYSELQYKIADSADVAATNVDTVAGGYSVGGTSEQHLMRITGWDSNLGVIASAGDTALSTNTPTYNITVTAGAGNVDSLYLFFTADDVTSTVSSYAVTTSNPTWTELYDETTNKNASLAYATRPEVTATGNATCTFSAGAKTVGQMVVVRAQRTTTISDTVTDTDSTTTSRTRTSTISDTVTDTDSVTATKTRQWTDQSISNSDVWVDQSIT